MERFRSALPVVLWAVMMLLFAACEKAIVSEDTVPDSSPTLPKDSKLYIQTRSPGVEVVSYPVTVYVIDAEGTCVAKEILATAEEELSIDLPAGTFQVYAIGGATDEVYDLPDVDDAEAEYEISLRDNAVHADLMSARNTVKLGRNETNRLTLSFVRKVMNVKSITISDVPEKVTSVSVSLLPLYKNLLLNGNYASGNNQEEATISLVKQDDGTTWMNAGESYLLPAEDETTVKVSMTLNGKTYTYMYACNQTLVANCDVNIMGTYTGNLGEFTMSGVLYGTTWDDPVNISFKFNEEGAEADNGGGSGNEPAEDEEAPALKSWYKNCFVFMSSEDDDYVTVTLLHRNEVDIDVEDKTQADFISEINLALPDFAINGMTAWRLPTQTEAEAIRANTFNLHIEDGADPMSANDLYFYDKGNNELGTFFGRGDLSSSFITSSVTFVHLRPVTTLKFRKQQE